MFNFSPAWLFESAITALPFSIHFRSHKMKNGKMLFYILRNTKEQEIFFKVNILNCREQITSGCLVKMLNEKEKKVQFSFDNDLR